MVDKDKVAAPREPVWTYRGYELKASEFTTAMVHLFRAEVQRANIWRQRLDTTTNWAVVTTGALISFAFSQAQGSAVVVLLNMVLVTMFLVIEARRYRYYELWSYRIRLMETDFFAAMLVPPFQPSPEWAESLAESLLQPDFPISNWEALGRRLRRNYWWIYAILGGAWLAHLWLLPVTAASWQEFIRRAEVGGIPGEIVLACMLAAYAAVAVLGLATLPLQRAAGEVLPRHDLAPVKTDEQASPGLLRAWFRPTHRRQQLLAVIITAQADRVSQAILKSMGRGVTALTGKGMYTGQERTVLLCALTVTEIAHLKHLAAEADPQAFVVVTPAQDVFGKGFMPLEEKT
jgi:uncharacterized membrane protein